MTEPVRWGILGLGGHAERAIAPAIDQAEGATLAAVCSADPERQHQFTSRYPGVRGFGDAGACAADVDAVFVASANDRHAEHIRAAVEVGRPVLCEKPLGVSPRQSAELIALCQRAGLPLGIGLHLRQSPGVRAARQLLSEGVIGTVMGARVEYLHLSAGEAPRTRPSWRVDPLRGGGLFAGTGIHALDLVRFLLGGEIAELTVLSQAARSDGAAAHLVSARLAPSSAARADACVSVTVGRAPFAANDVAVLGEHGWLRLEGAVGAQVGGTLRVAGDVELERSWPIEDPYRREIEEFCRTVREGTEPSGDALSGLRLSQLLVAAERAVAAPCWVRPTYDDVEVAASTS